MNGYSYVFRVHINLKNLVEQVFQSYSKPYKFTNNFIIDCTQFKWKGSPPAFFILKFYHILKSCCIIFSFKKFKILKLINCETYKN